MNKQTHTSHYVSITVSPLFQFIAAKPRLSAQLYDGVPRNQTAAQSGPRNQLAGRGLIEFNNYNTTTTTTTTNTNNNLICLCFLFRHCMSCATHRSVLNSSISESVRCWKLLIFLVASLLFCCSTCCLKSDIMRATAEVKINAISD